MKRELRANQVVGVGGVGAVVDIGDESFVVTDTTRWNNPNHKIVIPRMERRLRRDLIKPPADQSGSRGHVLLKRFPATLFCNKAACRKIVTKWNEQKFGNADGKPICPYCGSEGTLVPMRFVTACRAGHMNDVPWARWVRHAKPDCQSPSGLELRVGAGGTGGLESLFIRCPDCNQERDLSQIVAKDAMKSVGAKCLGRHPWRYEEHAQCTEDLEVLQRGATNLYYPVTASALSLEVIGEDETGEDETLRDKDDFKFLAELAEGQLVAGNFVPPSLKKPIEIFAKKYDLSFDRVLALLQSEGAGQADSEEGSGDWNESEVLAEEWAFLKSAVACNFRSTDLVSIETDVPRFRGKSPFDRVLLLHRLREVRAFLGFRRVEPGGTLVPPEAGRHTQGRPWYPAVEVFGEGIFLSLDEKWVTAWEHRLEEHAAELDRISVLERTRRDDNGWFLPAVSPRLIALHSLSHALMRQLVFESGYSSSALRERIYSGPGMAGVLIYTADGDSEGSLGGLVRQGQPNRLGDTIRLSLDKAIWCSADPVCSETAGQGLGGFNRAACHACSLVPETSCTTSNTLLDRGLLLGRDNMPGLLTDLL
jgi:hypothetical protein